MEIDRDGEQVAATRGGKIPSRYVVRPLAIATTV